MCKDFRPAVFLDRDGTINVDKGYLFQIEDFEYEPGVVEGLRKLYNIGFLLVIITNQSGIARGFYTEENCRKLNTWMLQDLANRGIEISGLYYCPHHPQGIISQYAVNCNCRKPKTGLYWKAQEDLRIDMEKSFAIGDKVRDLSICKESGARGILLGSGKENICEQRIWKCSNFTEAVRKIIYMKLL